VANETENQHGTVGAWAKRYYFANRAAIESVLRPYDLGSTQWLVLSVLVNDGATKQRDLVAALHVERATLSGVIATLVRKGFVAQVPDTVDQRQRLVEITTAGVALWQKLPDPIAVIQAASLDGEDAADVATAIRVLQAATQRLNDRILQNGDT
jgi:MarR family transcriptional regulator, lower aerobic nicotinate degradation pathway regulator